MNVLAHNLNRDMEKLAALFVLRVHELTGGGQAFYAWKEGFEKARRGEATAEQADQLLKQALAPNPLT